jgi:hypothetical protein
MMVAPVASPRPLASAPSAGWPGSDPAEFAAALAAASREPSRQAPDDTAADGAPSDDDGPPAPTGENGSALALDPAVALLLTALALTASPVEDGATAATGGAGLAGSTDVATPPLPTASPPAPPSTVGDLAALAQAMAGEDLVGLATVVAEPLPASAPLGPAAEVTLAPHPEALMESAIEPVAQPLPARAASSTEARPEPTTSTPAPTPSHLVEQIVPRLAARLAHGGELRITLQPQSLGTIDVSIRVSPAGIYVQIAADDAARDLLQAGLADLRGALRPSDGRELAIEVASRLSSGFDANTAFGGGSAWSAPPPPRRPRAAPAPTAPTDAVPTSTAAAGRIDYRI